MRAHSLGYTKTDITHDPEKQSNTLSNKVVLLLYIFQVSSHVIPYTSLSQQETFHLLPLPLKALLVYYISI